jgi:tetratricopeptide (TPR) repeat protein
MSDYFFIFLTIFITTGLIYILYIIMLGSGKDKDEDLQITSQELIEHLNILRQQKKYNLAESIAKKYLDKKYKDDGVRIILTKVYYDAGKIYEAIDHAKIIVKHQHDNYKMMIFLANCYIDIEKPMKAINVFLEVLEKDRDNAVAIKGLAEVYFDTNQKKSAIKMYQRLEDFLESNQEKAKNKLTIAKIHIEFGEFDLAIKEYEEILELYPDDINVKKALIELYKRVENYDALIALAIELLNTYPDEETGLWALKILMAVYKIIKNHEKAMEYANLIKLHPLSDAIQSDENIALILLDDGKIEESIELFKSLIAEDPNNIALKKELACAYEKNKDFKCATDIYKKILDEATASDVNQLHFELSNLYSNWAMYAFSQNDSEECFKHFTTAVEYFDQNPDIYYRLGNVNQIIKNFNEALSQYKKAIELNPQESNYYFAISECYREIDSIYDQKKYLLESLKYNFENAKIYYNLSVVYDAQNDNANAMLYIEKALEINPNYLDAKHKLALMLEHAGDTNGAIKAYEEILNLEPDNEVAINNLKMLQS